MTCFAIKHQQIENEIEEYSNYDWKAFGNLTFEEKMAEYLANRKMLLMRKRSKHIYLQRNAMNEKNEKRLRMGRKIYQLGKLINLLDCVVSQMEFQIMLLE